MLDQDYFTMPGIKSTVRRFERLIEIDKKEHTEHHILIRGPRGSGKNHFVKIFKEKEGKQMHLLNCATIHPEMADSTLFGHEKGAFTGADKGYEGHISAAYKEGSVLQLEELNSLPHATQAKLLVFMEKGEYFPVGSTKKKSAKVRIVATMNYEKSTKPPREDVLDRFGIWVNVPPISQRRGDIFYYLGRRYKDVTFLSSNLFLMFSYHWPGNFREMDRYVVDIKHKLPVIFPSEMSINLDDNSALIKLLNTLNLLETPPETMMSINKYLFKGLLPIADRPDKTFIVDAEVAENGTKDVTALKAVGWTMPLVKVEIATDDTARFRFVGAGDVTVDSDAVERFFKLVFGERCMTLPDPILSLEPFGEESLSYIRKLRYSYFPEGEWNSFSASPDYTDVLIYSDEDEELLKNLLLCLLDMCESVHLKLLASQCDGVEDDIATENQAISVKDVAEFLLLQSTTMPDIFRKMVSIAAERGISKKKVRESVGLAETTFNRYLKKGLDKLQST